VRGVVFLFTLLLLSGFSSGCGLTLDVSPHGMDAGPRGDSATGDGTADVVPDAVGEDVNPPCMIIDELCNATDDDCDGVVDESFDRSTDPLNCGTCGNVCGASPGQFAECLGGTCQVSCVDGLADCDVSVDGCETDLNDPETCGTCTNTCELADLCSGGACTIDCSATTTRCGVSCVHLMTDLRNCGTCGNVCSATIGAPTCTGGVCGVDCPPSSADCSGTGLCDTNLLDDRMHCGMCGNVCGTSQRCAAGVCESTDGRCIDPSAWALIGMFPLGGCAMSCGTYTITCFEDACTCSDSAGTPMSCRPIVATCTEAVNDNCCNVPVVSP
jgi:hypothetical protein